MKLKIIPMISALMVLGGAAEAMERGNYEGPADGGWLSVSVRASNFEIAMGGGSGCGGSGKGKIAKTGKDRWTVKLREDDQACRLDIQRQGVGRYNIEERGCSYFHGASCSFDGFVKKR